MFFLIQPGNLLHNPEDVISLRHSLCKVSCLHLACTRYLSDAIFSRITSTLGPLSKLSLAGCPISYQNAIYKRFYPAGKENCPSELVLTFKHILSYLESINSTLTELSFGRTGIDSTSLQSLALIPGLNLSSLHLMSCDQLTVAGVKELCSHQKNIQDLDLSLCLRLTDIAVLAIAEHLTGIKKLRLRRCQGITQVSF